MKLIERNSNFLNKLKHTDSSIKRMEKVIRQITDQWAFWPTFQKFMINLCITSYLNTLTVN